MASESPETCVIHITSVISSSPLLASQHLVVLESADAAKLKDLIL